MSKHWRPEGEIARIVPVRERGGASSHWIVTVALGAVLLGLAGGMAWQRWSARPAAAPMAAIEWNAVQAVPTRTPDAEDIAWQERAEELDAGTEPQPAGTRIDTAYVIDGDTFVMGGQKIRIIGIDAPETHPPRCADEARLGAVATQKLRELLGSGTVTLSGDDRDRYGRELRNVQVRGRDVAEMMIGAGLARRYAGGPRQGWC
jgi:hypothetical protein